MGGVTGDCPHCVLALGKVPAEHQELYVILLTVYPVYAGLRFSNKILEHKFLLFYLIFLILTSYLLLSNSNFTLTVFHPAPLLASPVSIITRGFFVDLFRNIVVIFTYIYIWSQVWT